MVLGCNVWECMVLIVEGERRERGLWFSLGMRLVILDGELWVVS